jgi:phosphatidylserine/phosphatidylglycerophosphate/cardiolipin synthase-like enzyme
VAKQKSKKVGLLWVVFVLVLAVLVYLINGNPTDRSLPQTISTPTKQEVKGVSTQVPTPTVYTSSIGNTFELYFTSPYYPGGIDKHLIDKINSSKISIDLAVYELNIEPVTQALINAEGRGVKVRVVYDNKQIADTVQVPELIHAGIPAVPDNRSAFMHDKFFVFDGQCIWTGSFNISMNAANKNFENAIYFCSPEAVQNYETEFSEMFAGEFGPTSSADTPNPTFVVNGIPIENYFAPEDHAMEKVIKAVSEAKSTIHFMTYSFTFDKLADEMITKGDSGVQIEGIFESTGANTSSSECGTLLKKGYDIRLDGNPATFHHKVIIIDGNTVIFGSFNFSAQADESNDENLLIIHSQELAQLFEQQYQLLKDRAFTPSGNICTVN